MVTRVKPNAAAFISGSLPKKIKDNHVCSMEEKTRVPKEKSRGWVYDRQVMQLTMTRVRTRMC